MKKGFAEVKFLEMQGMYLTTQQAAEYLGRSARALEDMRHKQRGPAFVKIAGSKRILYKKSDLIAWYYSLETKEVRASSARSKNIARFAMV